MDFSLYCPPDLSLVLNMDAFTMKARYPGPST